MIWAPQVLLAAVLLLQVFYATPASGAGLPFVPAEEAHFLAGDDLVLGVEEDGIAKAYPVRVLGRFEILNDTLGERSIVASW